MKPEHLKRIESLQSEVVDFHPILEQLFKRLPDVKSVEYRQGPNEKGADFVIVKYDNTLDEESYIGVICKIGKITQSNAEVERQIEECKLFPRLISSGKQRITLNEIWVVNNSTISGNAEEKIFLKFSGTNIKFINGSKVTALIEKYYKEFWSYNSINYGQYFSEICNQLLSGRENSFFGALDSGKFIQQKVVKVITKQNKSKPENLAQIILNERFIFLEGHVGSGKSTIIKQLLENQKVQIEEENDNITLPVIFQYSELTKTDKSILELTSEKVQKFKIPEDIKILVIIDGVDEVKEDSKSRIINFEKFVNQISTDNNFKLLITSRVMDSLQDYEAIDKMFTRYSIVPLSINQILKFVDDICQNESISKKLRIGIEKTPLFKFIPRTPISAILLARILKDEIKELPSTMTEMYAKYTEIVLGRWDTSKGIISQTEYEIIHSVLMNVSEFMMKNSLSCISQSEVQDIFLSYLEKRNIDIDMDKVLNRLLRRSEVATINPKNDTFSFVHRSFMEYFYAEKLKHDGTINLTEEIYDLYWNNTYFFYLGLLRDSEKCIDIINSIEPSNNQYKFSRLFTNGTFYLAAYLTPYTKIQVGVENTFVEAGRLYEDIMKNENIKELNQFPPMALLCIFTRSLSNNFSYEYFERALINISINLDKTLNPSVGEQYTRFFIASALNELGHIDAFDKIVDKNNLDILVQLGITHVTKDTGLVSKKIERYFKKLKNQYRGNKIMSNYMIDLHNKSIDEIDIKNKKMDVKIIKK